MANFLERLMEEMQGVTVDESVLGLQPVGEKEHVLGEVSDETAKKMWARAHILAKELEPELEELIKKARCDEPPDKKELCRLAGKKAEIEFLKGAFWRAVHYEIPQTDEVPCGLRTGWKIVALPEEEEGDCPGCPLAIHGVRIVNVGFRVRL